MRVQPHSRVAPLIFFFDHNLGKRIVAEALRHAGAEVEVYDDHFPPGGSNSASGGPRLRAESRAREDARADLIVAQTEGGAQASVTLSSYDHREAGYLAPFCNGMRNY